MNEIINTVQVKMIAQGQTMSSVAKELGIPLSSFTRWLKDSRTIRAEYLYKIMVHFDLIK